MMQNTVLITQSFQQTVNSSETFDEFLDRILDELDSLEVEADYSANLEELTAQWAITVQSKTPIDSISAAVSALGSALRKVQGAGWTLMPKVHTAVQEVDSDYLISA